MKPGKTRIKVFQGNADTIIRQPIVQIPRVPPTWRGGETKKGAMIRQTTVKNLPRTGSVAGGRETKKGELKENAGVVTKETNVNPPLQAAIVAGGRDGKAKTNTKWKGGTAHSPARGGSA